MFGEGEVSAQTTYTINNTNSYTLPPGNNGATIILGFTGDGWGQINLGENTNVTVSISNLANLGGAIIQTGTAPYALQVFGTLIGDRNLPSGSTLIVETNGKTSNYGSISMSNGLVTNKGTISNSLILSNSSIFSNTGTSSGTVTLNGATTYTNSSIATGQTGTVYINGTSQYISSGKSTGAVILNGANAQYTLHPGGTQTIGGVTVTNGNLTNYTGAIISSNVTLSNFSTYSNSGTHTANLTLTGSSSLTNYGTVTSASFNTGASSLVNNTSSGVIQINGSPSLRGIISTQGNINVTGNATLTGSSTILSVLNSGKFTVQNDITLTDGGKLATSNPSNTIPQATVTARDLLFANNGSGQNLTVDANTVINLSRDLQLNGYFPISLSGALTLGRDFNASNNGSEGVILNIMGNGAMDVSRNFTTNKGINLTGNAHLLVHNNYSSENTGGVINGTTLNGNSSLGIQGSATFNRPLIANDNSIVDVGINFTLPNVGGAKVTMNSSSTLKISGTTTLHGGPLTFKNSSMGNLTDVNISGNGDSQLQVFNNGEVLVNGNLVKQSSGTIAVQNSGQLVICGAGQTSGSIQKSFPPAANQNMNIGPSPAYYGGCRVLSVVFVEFAVKFIATQRISQILWSTSNEWENSHFEIERSVNQLKDWETIGQVSGAGYSDRPIDYSYRDLQLPLHGGTVFYRVKQWDLDGDFSYSDILSIQVEKMQDISNWRIFPNPTTGDLFNLELLDRGTYQDEPLTLRIISSIGQVDVIRSKTGSLLNTRISDLLKNKTSGVYTLEISWGTQLEYHKVVLTR